MKLPPTQPDPERRAFVAGTAGALGLIALAPGFRLVDLARARNASEPASAAVRWGLLIDTARCSDGCDDCVRACDREFGLSTGARPEIDAHYMRKLDLEVENGGRKLSLPMLCQHCAHPPCVDVCPTGASMQRADGIVLVDKHICIGCRYCMMACPYKARSFIHENLTDQLPHAPRGKGTVESCNLCAHRVDRGDKPACVDACSEAGHDALSFGDLNDSGGAIARRMAETASYEVRSDLGLDTGVRYVGL